MKRLLLSMTLLTLTFASFAFEGEEGTISIGNGSGDLNILPTDDSESHRDSDRFSYGDHDINFPAIIATVDENEMVTFERCIDAYSCKFIGRPYGYDLDMLDFSPNVRRAKAIGYGVGEAVLIVGGTAIGYVSLVFGAVPITYASAAAVTTGVAGIANDSTNPAYLFGMASIENSIQRDDLLNGIVAIECEDEDELLDKTIKLKKILADLI